MATFSKALLSNSVNGMPIEVTGNPNTVHTAQSGTSGLDEVWMYAHNPGSTTVKLTLEFGGQEPYHQIELNIPGESGLVLVIPGLPLNNSKQVVAYTSSGAVGITGYVNRITA